MMVMSLHDSRGYLTASEAVAVFKRGLDQELGLATAARFDGGDVDERTPRVFEAVYRIAARLDPEATSVSAELLTAHTEGFQEEDRRAVVLMLKAIAPHATARTEAAQVLTSIDAPLNAAAIRDARVQTLLAKAEAQARALMMRHLAEAAGDPLSQLINDDAVVAIRTEQSRTLAPPAPAADVTDCPYLTVDTRRFSEIIESTIAAIQRSGDWNNDTAQCRTAMRAFAWSTGNKRLCDYRPADAELFAQTLDYLPKSFKWGTPDAGAMSRPFIEVMAETPAAEGSAKRSGRTLNRDLATMSRVAGQLAKVGWKPKLGASPIMNFVEHCAGVIDDINDPDRMPWTEENLRVAFSSPVYTGGGGCSKRFKEVLVGSAVWQDAAYWVPLIMAFTFVARKEACGLECADFVFDVAVPHLIIQANMTRSKDGETPGGLGAVGIHRE